MVVLTIIPPLSGGLIYNRRLAIANKHGCGEYYFNRELALANSMRGELIWKMSHPEKTARHDFGSSPPDKRALLGENGCTVSGGERQRISIAGALLKDAPIVLLDEATASLDPENEVQIQEAVSELVSGRTVIVIAHRLRTVSGADNIIVLDNGNIVEQGKSGELLENYGLFARLFNIQQDSLGWSVKA